MINPQISLGIEPMRIQTGQEALAKHLQVRGAQQQMAANDLSIEEQRQKAAELQRQQMAQQRLSELLAANAKQGPNGALTVDHNSVYRGLAESGFGDVALKYDATRRADQRAAIEDAKKKLDVLKEQNDVLAQHLGAVIAAPEEQKAQAYGIVRGWAIQRGLIGEEDAPAAYDPQFVEQAFRGGIDTKAQLEEHRRDLEFDQKVIEHEAAVREKAPKTAGEWQSLAARLLAASTDQHQWTVALKSLQDSGAPAAALAPFGEAFGQAAATRAADIAIAPDKRAELQLAEAGRQETARHNLATEKATIRGQNMTDTRARELNAITRDQKPATAGERTAAGYLNRAVEANKILESLGPMMAKKGLVDQAAYNYLPNFAQGDEEQLYRQAQRQFTESRLRKESGAAIVKSEYENDERMFFPQPGDSGAVLEQKALARKSVLKGLEIQSGRALAELGLAPVDATAPPAAPAKTAAPGAVTVELPGGRVATFPSAAAAQAFRKATGMK